MILYTGIIATVLDEAMVKLAFELGINAVTAKMETKFRKPVFRGKSEDYRQDSEKG